jgi:3-hydroxyacyl-CoA dehydrogenase
MRAAASTQIDNSVAVLRAGAMGRGIAAAFARAGFPTTIVDLDESALEAARAEIETRLEAGDPRSQRVPTSKRRSQMQAP